MLEKGDYLEVELSDVMDAKVLGTDLTIDDWPWGSKERCSMHFFVEDNGKKGQRFVKQSTKDSKIYKPKRGTYSNKILIIEVDGKIGHIALKLEYGMATVYIEHGRYIGKTFFDDEFVQIKEKFFS